MKIETTPSPTSYFHIQCMPRQIYHPTLIRKFQKINKKSKFKVKPEFHGEISPGQKRRHHQRQDSKKGPRIQDHISYGE